MKAPKELEQLTRTFEDRISSLTSKHHANAAALREQLQKQIDKHTSTVNTMAAERSILKADHLKELDLVEKKHSEKLTNINAKFQADLDQHIKRSTSTQESLRNEIRELNKTINKTKLDMADLSHKHTVEVALLNDLHVSNVKMLEDRYEKDIIALKSKSKDKAMKIYKENVQKLKAKHEAYTVSQRERYNMLCNDLSSQKWLTKMKLNRCKRCWFLSRRKAQRKYQIRSCCTKTQ